MSEEPEASSVNSPGEMGYMYSSSDQAIGVLDFERGRTARNRIHENNEFAADADPGKEYLCLYVKAKRIDPGGGDMSVSVYDQWCKVEGDRKTIHDGGTINPEPELHADLMEGGEAEGWITRECYEGETGLIAIIEPSDTYTEFYIALEED